MSGLQALKSKKFIVSVLFVMLSLWLVGTQLSDLRDRLTSARTESLVKTVEGVYAQVVNYHQLAMNGDMRDEDARAAALKVLRETRHSASEYFWVTDYSGRFLMHPIDAKLEGQLMPTLANTSELLVHQEVARRLQRQGKGFVTYQWPKPDSSVPVEKISYVKGFSPWGWGIGSGVYIDDIDQAFWVELQTLLQIFAILLAVLVVFWFGFHSVLFPTQESMSGAGSEAAET